MNKITLAALLAITTHALVYAKNPIISEGSADPSARVFGNRIYIYPSHDLSPNNADWIMKDWKAWSSSDLKNWTDHGVILRGKDITWAKNKNHCWAPDCTEHKGKYYFYFPIGGYPGVDEIGVAVADSPTGPFKDALGKPLVTTGDSAPRHIDPCVFTDDDGKSYLIWGNAVCHIAPLADNMVSFSGPIKIISGLRNFDEGPWMHKYNGRYYLSYCHGGTGPEGRIEYAVSDKGPVDGFIYKGCVIAPNAKIKGTAHHSIVKFKDRWYVFYHTLQPTQFYRKTCVDELFYNADGTIREVMPTINGPKP